MMGEVRERARRRSARVVPNSRAERGEIEKWQNKRAINILKTNDSAQSRDFAPNDFNGLRRRFVSLGAFFPSFGAIFSLLAGSYRL
jgi:hypothetical protein